MKPIIIDTDMGNDDIIAICMLLLSKKFSVKAISVVNGVASTNAGTKNLAKILAFIGRTDIPIISGAQQALLEKKAAFPLIDRQRANSLSLLSELNIPQFSLTRMPITNSLDSLSRIIFNQKPTILCLGPLTNIAKAIQRRSNFGDYINEIVVMGGAVFSPGNVSPTWLTEYNIALDPLAAKIVFSSDLPITLVATDATKQVPATNKQFLEQVLSTKPQTATGKIIKTIVINNRRDFIDFYDPLAAAILVNPKIISCTKKINLTIAPDGQTIGQLNTKGNVNLVTKIDKQSFYRFLINSIN